MILHPGTVICNGTKIHEPKKALVIARETVGLDCHMKLLKSLKSRTPNTQESHLQQLREFNVSKSSLKRLNKMTNGKVEIFLLLNNISEEESFVNRVYVSDEAAFYISGMVKNMTCEFGVYTNHILFVNM